MSPSAALAPGAGEGNRTLVISLEGFCSTIELHPRKSWCRPCSQATGGSYGAGRRLHRRPTYPSNPAQSPNLMINRSKLKFWWRGLDSNQRTQRGQIYSLLPLTTRPPLPRKPQIIADFGGSRQTNEGFPPRILLRRPVAAFPAMARLPRSGQEAGNVRLDLRRRRPGRGVSDGALNEGGSAQSE